MTQDQVVVVLDISTISTPSPRGGRDLRRVMGQFGAALTPVFERPATRLPMTARMRADATELGRYFRAEIDTDKTDDFLAMMRELPGIAGAYRKPRVESPLAPRLNIEWRRPGLLRAGFSAGDIPDLRTHQGYHQPAPAGVNSAAAWSEQGGRGAGVEIIDIEGGWCFTHADLAGNGGLRGGTEVGQDWRDHGTAVLGVLAARENGFGMSGVAPDAIVSGYSHNNSDSSGAIQRAGNLLRRGDILLLEMHGPGPRHNFEERGDQAGYIAVEWWPDDFIAIRNAVNKGIIVVEAAGNGAEDLNDAVYDRPRRGFPADWRNPFRGGRDSGAILVGAGAPPSGNFGPDRSRLDFSNHGQRIDCQGWGEEVATTGYGDLFEGVGESEYYTSGFAGTSSASPIVAGAVASLQGIARARRRALTPQRMRDLLRSTGSPQQAGPNGSGRIGNRPDLAGLIASL